VSITAMDTCPPRLLANRHASRMVDPFGTAVSKLAKAPLATGAGEIPVR
jgi:hypothetical protein